MFFVELCADCFPCVGKADSLDIDALRFFECPICMTGASWKMSRDFFCASGDVVEDISACVSRAVPIKGLLNGIKMRLDSSGASSSSLSRSRCSGILNSIDVSNGSSRSSPKLYSK